MILKLVKGHVHTTLDSLSCWHKTLSDIVYTKVGWVWSVRVNVVLNRTIVVDSDWGIDNLCGSHLQSQSDLYHVSWWYYTLVIQLTLTMKMTTAQVVKTSVTVNNNSPIQDYVHPDDQTRPTFEMTPGFKPFTVLAIKFTVYKMCSWHGLCVFSSVKQVREHVIIIPSSAGCSQ